MSLIEFGPWLPDQPAFAKPHLVDAKNVIPYDTHYQPARALASTSDALPARPRGAAAMNDKDETVHVYAGDEDSLYELQSDQSWLDISRLSGGAYSLAGNSRWTFTRFGDECIACCLEEEMQAITMSSGSNFANLGGSPPQARYCTTFGDFLVVGYTDTSAAEVRWAGLNSTTDWTVGTNQADSQTLPDGGDVRGFAPTEDALLIFQQSKIRLMQYVGPPLIMQIDVIEEKLGCLDFGSIAQHGKKVFFLAPDGFYMIDGFAPAVAISEGKVAKWFLDDVDEGNLGRMSAAVDPNRQVVVWNYASKASATGTPDTQLVYYWPRQRWAYWRTGAELVFTSLGLGYTLEDLDAIYPSIDGMDLSLDDPLWRGGAVRFGAFNSDFEFGAFGGATIESTLTASELEPVRGMRSFVTGVRPMIDTDAITVNVGSRPTVHDSVTWSADFTLEGHGEASGAANGRYHRVRCVMAAGASWDEAQGYMFNAAPDGEI